VNVNGLTPFLRSLFLHPTHYVLRTAFTIPLSMIKHAHNIEISPRFQELGPANSNVHHPLSPPCIPPLSFFLPFSLPLSGNTLRTHTGTISQMLMYN